jgi:hypothetical protein
MNRFHVGLRRLPDLPLLLRDFAPNKPRLFDTPFLADLMP